MHNTITSNTPVVQAQQGLWQPPEVFLPERPGKWTDFWVRLLARLTVLWLAIRAYRSPGAVMESLRYWHAYRQKIIGGNGKRKLVKRNGKYWFGLYVPPFPSLAFNRFILTELYRHQPHSLRINAYQQVNLAITTHCPMHCEHCFEWDNLHKPETFSPNELGAIISGLQQEGTGLISLSGGEPMVRFQDLLTLVSGANKDTSFWVITSGFNLTPEKARALKAAGVAGVNVSLDHYVADEHNRFRGNREAFLHAVQAIQAARNAGLVVAVSVCFTRTTAHKGFLRQHTQFAGSLGADFVQWLEPRPEGRYRGRDVLLEARQIELLEQAYESYNHSAEGKALPVIIYHGYHQRRFGCLQGGRFSFYIDAAGMMHSCPFCHSADFPVAKWLSLPAKQRPTVSPCRVFWDQPVL